LSISGIILAGGLARRMNGVDKGLVELSGKPMVAHVLARLQPQVDEILINANRELEQYASFGHAVIPDEIAGFAGPLAGLHRGMTAASEPFVMTVPCDSPYLPTDLAARLMQALNAEKADLAVAKTGHQTHPVFCLCRRELAPHLAEFLRGGGRKIDAWYATLKVVEVPFDDEADGFANINTLEELKSLEQQQG